VSLTVDLSLAQVAFITAETVPLLRRLFPRSAPVLDLAARIERFLAARADTIEARMRASELLRAWVVFAATPSYREFIAAHLKHRGVSKQDQVSSRMRQLATALRAAPVRERSARVRTSAA
jgi:hypothetical protein